MNTQPLPTRRTSHLLIGRQSIPDASYFLTLCEVKRHPGLLDPIVAQELKGSLDRIHASADFTLIAATVMPDHIHLLGILGRRLSLSRVVGKFKVETHRSVRPHGLAWQENYHDQSAPSRKRIRTVRPLRFSESLSGWIDPTQRTMAMLVALG
ncbi:MAG: hypothetical protein EXS32_12510 [Opitutus sp.]|nr:hypothetical protein [Opitutus sp.]